MTPEQGEMVLARIRETLPPSLQPVWRFGLTIIFGVGALLVVTLDPDRLSDYLRIFAWAQGVYIVVIAGRVAEVNYGIRSQLDRENLAANKIMPTHIILLAVSTIGSVLLLSSVMVTFYGEGSVYPAFPWLVNGLFLVTVLGLNWVWRFVAQRRRQAK